MKRVVSAYPLINRIKEKKNKILDYGWDLYIDNRKKKLMAKSNKAPDFANSMSNFNNNYRETFYNVK